MQYIIFLVSLFIEGLKMNCS